MSRSSGPVLELIHGVNLSMLGRRNPQHYGTLTLQQLEQQVTEHANKRGFEVNCFQSDSESELIKRLHSLQGSDHRLILNAGAWTHYSWALRDALELAEVTTVEVHLSAVNQRESWRQVSVFDGLCVKQISGKGIEGYLEAVDYLAEELG